jgi:hypothetical protein
MTTPASPPPARPANPADAALFDAVNAEHGTIYAYGLISAHTTPEVNALVADALAAHRANREAGIAALTARSVPAPVPAAGYQMPSDLNTPEAAARDAVRIEEDTATAWRAVAEQAGTAEDRTLAVKALTDCAVLAARWRQVLGVTPTAVPFPGGTE